MKSGFLDWYPLASVVNSYLADDETEDTSPGIPSMCLINSNLARTAKKVEPLLRMYLGQVGSRPRGSEQSSRQLLCFLMLELDHECDRVLWQWLKDVDCVRS